MRIALTNLCTLLLIGTFVLFLPIGPFLLFLVTGKTKFVTDYFGTLRRAVVHLGSLRENGSVRRFFGKHWLGPETPVEIGGHCNRCGNCCLNRKCLFLERHGESEYLCGIYGTGLRRLTNCGAYPVSQTDIEQYACPTYYVVRTIPIKTYRPEVPATVTTRGSG